MLQGKLIERQDEKGSWKGDRSGSTDRISSVNRGIATSKGRRPTSSSGGECDARDVHADDEHAEEHVEHGVPEHADVSR
ncbi:hypothetical protein IU436_26435 [Nocardia farcinica]|uniref:hypothetical protein n=1 Tax=Nocardia TaxID=1817 RepID=UPI0018946DAB|nr:MULTISPECIES: hypothetical protein [Nocardia]MBF6289736.1 hypothetical protein [Nocardia cyriacigeorgica]MBF6422228.1 hypothetical protein [Nocardia farcinica]MBF6433884.1 hypothetical protein [Nocardia farcinica]MBF6504952.1 hypothetical protein [Nocardia farcinica]